MLQQQQNLGRRFGTSKMHLSPPPPRPGGYGCCPFKGDGSVVVDFLFIVIVLCFVVRYFMSSLVLQSSWLGRESWLLCVEWLFLAVPWGFLQFVIVFFPYHTHLIFFIPSVCCESIHFWTDSVSIVSLQLIYVLVTGGLCTTTTVCWFNLSKCSVEGP